MTELYCPHLPPCPGCPRFGAQEPAAEATRQLAELCAARGVKLSIRSGERLHFRHRARLSVRGRTGSAKIGIFAEGSHRVVDIPRCQIHHPLINTVARALKASMHELGASAYSDTPHVGLVRALQVVVERSTQTAQVVLVCNETEPVASMVLLEALARRLGPKLHSLWWNGNAERTNVILGQNFRHLSGPAHVVERLGGAEVYFPPGAFGQNNLDLFDRMLEEIHAKVPAERDVVELYAGTGGIGLGLVARSRSIVFNEIGPASLAGLERGIAALPEGERQRVQVIPGSAEVAAGAVRSDTVVIVDPPRKGLAPELLARLVAVQPELLIYVSCGLGSFARDAEVLTSHGSRLESATAFDLFPYTAHIETLAFFRR
jgi:23S rRNA (uracil1939-C5)-methyltransferase